MARVRAWRYVDERRTHDVQAWLEVGDHNQQKYVIRETGLGMTAPEDAHTESHLLTEPWESTFHQAALETRLCLLGRYLRHDSASPGWVPLRVAMSGKSLDLAPLSLDDAPDSVEFHHYDRAEGGRAVTLLGVEQSLPAGKRHLLARLDFRYPDVDGGVLRVIHSRLPPPVYRSLLAMEHLDMAQFGFRKTGEGIRADPRGWAALRAALDAILARLIEGRLSETKAEHMQRLPPAAIDALKNAGQTFMAQRGYDVDDEGAGPATTVSGPKPKAMIDELDPGILAALQDSRLLALHARYLRPGEDAALIAQGELAIRAAIKRRRGEVEAKEQHFISILEASLLMRAALTNRVRIDSEIINRVKHAGAWL